PLPRLPLPLVLLTVPTTGSVCRMEVRVIARGVIAGFITGIFSFIFARTWSEPFINKAINYESGRDAAIAAVDRANGVAANVDDPTIFDRSVQSSIGLATGL